MTKLSLDNRVNLEGAALYLAGKHGWKVSIGGDGGLIETSGAKVNTDPAAKITAAAPYGKAGKWLLDPTDITVDANMAATTMNSLNGGTDVTLQTLAGTGNGDQRQRADRLEFGGDADLRRYRNIAVNASITHTGGDGGVNFIYGNHMGPGHPVGGGSGSVIMSSGGGNIIGGAGGVLSVNPPAPPTIAPTTVAPTLASTTMAPTTPVTTKMAPTKMAPTTMAQTTMAPTIAPTSAPTSAPTAAPTTVAPTTVALTAVSTAAPGSTGNQIMRSSDKLEGGGQNTNTGAGKILATDQD